MYKMLIINRSVANNNSEVLRCPVIDSRFKMNTIGSTKLVSINANNKKYGAEANSVTAKYAEIRNINAYRATLATPVQLMLNVL